MRLEDTGKLSDNVRLSITVTDREDRTHTYLYRSVMRYKIDEQGDGNVYIHFNVDPADRMHEAVKVMNNTDSLAAELTTWLLARDPRMLTAVETASAEACAALCNVLALITASVMAKMPEHAPDIKAGILAKVDRTIDKTLEAYLAKLLRSRQ